MNTNNRKFKRQMVNPNFLSQIAPKWSTQLEPVLKAWQLNEITSGETAALYLFKSLEMYHPDLWAAGPNDLNRPGNKKSAPFFNWFTPQSKVSVWLNLDASIYDCVEKISFLGVRQSAREILLKWLNQDVPLQLNTKVPTPIEMLDEQARGVRTVTAFFAVEQLAWPDHDGRDALSFFLHDLGHAAQFYDRPDWHQGQIKIYQRLLKAMNVGLLNIPGVHSEEWTERLNYLIADLNTHPVHFMSVFWAAARDSFSEGFKSQQFKRWRFDLYQCWEFAGDLIEDYESLCTDYDLVAAERVLVELTAPIAIHNQ